jgi:hypothetical protein
VELNLDDISSDYLFQLREISSLGIFSNKKRAIEWK